MANSFDFSMNFGSLPNTGTSFENASTTTTVVVVTSESEIPLTESQAKDAIQHLQQGKGYELPVIKIPKAFTVNQQATPRHSEQSKNIQKVVVKEEAMLAHKKEQNHPAQTRTAAQQEQSIKRESQQKEQMNGLKQGSNTAQSHQGQTNIAKEEGREKYTQTKEEAAQRKQPLQTAKQEQKNPEELKSSQQKATQQEALPQAGRQGAFTQVIYGQIQQRQQLQGSFQTSTFENDAKASNPATAQVKAGENKSQAAQTQQPQFQAAHRDEGLLLTATGSAIAAQTQQEQMTQPVVNPAINLFAKEQVKSEKNTRPGKKGSKYQSDQHTIKEIQEVSETDPDQHGQEQLLEEESI